MKKIATYVVFAVGFLLTACSKKEEPIDIPVNPATGVVEVSGDIKTNTTWTADKIYLLKGFVYVTDGAVLTIEPGTIIKGDKTTKGSLIVTRGSKMMAVGTPEKPIVFTSNLPAGARNGGDWGGLIILGKAPVNQPGGEVVIEGGLTPTAGGTAAKYTTYGGNDPEDNSGKLKYVRVEYAGIAYAPDNETNGITFGGVGRGTEIDYVQVYRSGDDAFEWFGGTVNAKHILAIGSLDDDFDTDFGYSGKIQFALAQRYKTLADVSGSNGFESDNDGSGTNATPQTSAIFSNITVVGPMTKATVESNTNANYQHAVQIRRNSALSIFNSVFVGYPEGIFIDDALPTSGGLNSSGNFTSGKLAFENNIIYGCNSKGNEIKGVNATSKAVFEAALRANNVFEAAKYSGELMVAPNLYSSDFASAGTPNFLVKSGAISASGASFSSAKFSGDSFFDKSTGFKGAFGTTDWSAGWAHFDVQNLPYTTPGAVK